MPLYVFGSVRVDGIELRCATLRYRRRMRLRELLCANYCALLALELLCATGATVGG